MNFLKTLIHFAYVIALIILVWFQMTIFWFVMILGMFFLPIITFGKFKLFTIDGKSYSLHKKKKNEDGWEDVNFNKLNNSSVESENINQFEWVMTEWGLKNIKSEVTIPISRITIPKDKIGVYIESESSNSEFIDKNKIRDFK